MTINSVFVLDTDKKPLTPCSPARARQFLRDGKAAVFRRYPFTIILKVAMPNAIVKPLTVKIDPGSRHTGFALVNSDNRALFGAELEHRGKTIKAALDSRRAVRRGRRARNTRYRAARFNNRVRAEGWLPPSLQHRVETTMTWLNRFRRWCNVEFIAVERVKFDMQLMRNPEISGVEYQQGTLQGYSCREYLLEKWRRKCAYCGAEQVPLQVEHIHPKAKGGGDAVSNLTLACEPCNKKKGAQDLSEFLAKKPDVLKRILAQLKKPLSDAAAVNATRNKLFVELLNTRLPVETGTGAQTKFNRIRLEYPKAHWIDAACVGDSGATVTINNNHKPLMIVSRGQGGRQKAVLNKYGYPIQHRALRPINGWRNGDIAEYEGKVYSICPRKTGSFELSGHGKTFSRTVKKLKRVQLFDGYKYG